jgi:hypothetical protein
LENDTGKGILKRICEGVGEAFRMEITVAQAMNNVVHSHLDRKEAVALGANASAQAFLSRPDGWDSVV